MKRFIVIVLGVVSLGLAAQSRVYAHAFQYDYVTGFCMAQVSTSSGAVADCVKTLNFQAAGCSEYNTTSECLSQAKSYEESLIKGGYEQNGADKICTADFQKDIQLYGLAKATQMIQSVACAFTRVMPPGPDCLVGIPDPKNPKQCIVPTSIK